MKHFLTSLYIIASDILIFIVAFYGCSLIYDYFIETNVDMPGQAYSFLVIAAPFIVFNTVYLVDKLLEEPTEYNFKFKK